MYYKRRAWALIAGIAALSGIAAPAAASPDDQPEYLAQKAGGRDSRPDSAAATVSPGTSEKPCTPQDTAHPRSADEARLNPVAQVSDLPNSDSISFIFGP
jgi:hypothetical protein